LETVDNPRQLNTSPHQSGTPLVVEVVSPDSSFRTDTVDKKATYAAAGIPTYLIVFLNEAKDGVELIERSTGSPKAGTISSPCTPGGRRWTVPFRSTPSSAG
jgi:hypothetical protein